MLHPCRLHPACCTGDQNAFRIVERGDSNGGQYMVMHEWVRNTTGGFTPGLIGSPFPHVHPGQVEYFKVIEGTAGVHVNGTRRIYAAGKVVAVPQGVEHFFWNADTGGNLLMEIKLAPAMQSDVFFEQLAGASLAPSLAEVAPLALAAEAEAARRWRRVSALCCPPLHCALLAGQAPTHHPSSLPC